LFKEIENSFVGMSECMCKIMKDMMHRDPPCLFLSAMIAELIGKTISAVGTGFHAFTNS